MIRLHSALQLAESSLRDPQTSPQGSETPEETPRITYIDDPRMEDLVKEVKKEGNLEKVKNILNSSSKEKVSNQLLSC